MSKSNNVRVENGVSFNVGSLNLKKTLLEKVKHQFKNKSYQELNVSVKEIVKTGVYEQKNQKDGSMIHLFRGKEICVELNAAANVITKIYQNQEIQQKESSLKLVKSDGDPLPRPESIMEESFIEASFSILSNKLLELEEYSHLMSQSLSKTDKEISKIYHKLETTNFNASQGYFYAKSLQSLLRKRRFFKTEIDKIHATNKELHQMKDLVQQSEKKILTKQNQYESYSEGWGLDQKDFVE